MNKSELAQLALRLYCDKGFWHNELARRIVTKGDYSQVLRYELGNEDTIKSDVETLQELAQTYGGLYIDLFALDEIAKNHIFIPVSERPVYDARYDAAMRQRLGDDLYQFVIDIVECRVAVPDFFPTELQELCDLARLKWRLEHNKGEPVDYAPSEPVDLEADNEFEPVTIMQDKQQILGPHSEIKPGLQRRPAWSGKI